MISKLTATAASYGGNNAAYELGFGIDFFTEYFIFSPSVRGMFGITDELIRDKPINGPSPWTDNIDSMKSRAILINFTFH